MPKKCTEVLVKDVCKGMKNLKLRCIVLDADPIVEIFGRKYRLYRVADETARINLVIWDDAVTKISGGDILKLTRLYCTIWRNRLTMFTSKYSRIYKQGKFCMPYSEAIDMSLPIEDESFIVKQMYKYSLKSFLGFSSVDEPDTNYTYKGKLTTEKKRKLEDAELESMISDGDEEDEDDDEDEDDSDQDNENVLYSKLISSYRSSSKMVTTIGNSINKKGPGRVIEESNKRKTSESLDFDELERACDEKQNKYFRKNASCTVINDISANCSMLDRSGEQNIQIENNKYSKENLDGTKGTAVNERFANNGIVEGPGKVKYVSLGDNKPNREDIDDTECIVVFDIPTNDRLNDLNEGQNFPLGNNKPKEEDINGTDCNDVVCDIFAGDEVDDRKDGQNVQFEKGDEKNGANMDNTESGYSDKKDTDKISQGIAEKELGFENLSNEDRAKCEEEMIIFDSPDPPLEEADAELDQYIVEVEDNGVEPSNDTYVERTHSVCVEGMMFEYVEEVEVGTTEMNDDVCIEENIEYEEVDYETSTVERDDEPTEESEENFAGFVDEENFENHPDVE